MKKLIILFVCILSVSDAIRAQSLTEILGSNKILSDLFVSPLGIENAIEEKNFISLTDKMSALGLEYKTINLGQYGNAVGIKTDEMCINGVDIDNVMILVQDNINGIIYQSVSCDNYREMFDFINEELMSLSQIAEKSISVGNMKVHMLTPEYGIAVGAFDQNKIVMTMLVDMRNLFGFLGSMSSESNV